MKLSEILKDWEKKKPVAQYSEEPMHGEDILMNEGFNIALTSCDREIDKEALAMQIKHIGGVLVPMLLARTIAKSIISTMPTWLKPIERK